MKRRRRRHESTAPDGAAPEANKRQQWIRRPGLYHMPPFFELRGDSKAEASVPMTRGFRVAAAPSS